MDSGEVHRGKIRPATRQSLREWLNQFTQRFFGKQMAIAVEATTGWPMAEGPCRSAEMVAYLDALAEEASEEVGVVLDNAPFHTAGMVKE